jgi:hypothetical protein
MLWETNQARFWEPDWDMDPAKKTGKSQHWFEPKRVANKYKEGHSELAPNSTPWRMNGKWSGNSFLLGSSSPANRGG